MSEEEIKVVATNRKAGFEYFLLERFEAGLSLQGSEIKSIRAGQVSLTEAYVRIEANEAWLIEAHFATYAQANRMNHVTKRPRRLLLHKKEISKLWDAVRMKGVTIIPTKIYIKGGRAKLEISIAKGKNLHDKRDTIAKRDQDREMRRNDM